jgi:hypothetical protein
MPLKDMQEGLKILLPPDHKDTLTSALSQLEAQHRDKSIKIPKHIPVPSLDQRLAMIAELKGDATVFGWRKEGAHRERVPLDTRQKTTLRCAIAASLTATIPELKKRPIQKAAMDATAELWRDHLKQPGGLLSDQERHLLAASLDKIAEGKPSRLKNEAGDLGRLILGEQTLSPGRAAKHSGTMLGKIAQDQGDHELLAGTLKALSSEHKSTTVMQNHLSVIKGLEADTAVEGSLMTASQRGQARCAVVAAALQALPTCAGEVERQEAVINAVSTLWNDYSSGKLSLGPAEKLLMAKGLAGTFLAKTPHTAKAAELRGLFLDKETHARAKSEMQPIPAFPDPSQILDLGEVALEDRSEASQQQTRPAVMAEIDEIDYRIKDIKYGNSRAATEVLDGSLTSMTGMDAPDAKLAVNGAHLFNPSRESRGDYNNHAQQPAQFAYVASPLTLEYQDLGDLAHDNGVMRGQIEKERGEGGALKYDAALTRYADAAAAETKMLEDQKKTGHADVQKQLDSKRQGLAVEKAMAIEQLARLPRGRIADESTEDALDPRLLGVIEEAPKTGMGSVRSSIHHKLQPTHVAALENTLRRIHASEADLNEQEDKHWEPNRSARMEKYNAMMDMVNLFPEHMKEEVQKLHMVSLLNHNFDPYNWGLANAGFSTIGEMVKWRISVVDHGNSVMDGFGGMQKVNSWLRGNTRARKDDPLMPNFVLQREVQPDYVPASITGISSFQRAMPFVRLLKDMIKAETRVADTIPIDQFMMKYEKELEPAIEMAYRFSLIPKDAYDRVAKNKWPGGETGEGSELFPWRPGDVHRSAAEVSEILFDRKQAIIDHFPQDIIDAWKAKYPEKATAAYNEVAAGIAGTTGYYIDHPDSRPSSVRSAMI